MVFAVPHHVAGWCAVACLLAAVWATPGRCQVDTPRVYPANVYPIAASGIPRGSDVAFTETEESRRFGYDVPFPEVQRAVFEVEAYGAAPDGQTDCTAAFCAAVEAARRCGGPAEVRFAGTGRYLFLPDRALGSDDLSILNVRDASNLLIRGQGPGTVLMMGDPALGGLMVSGGEMVMVRDLAIDYCPLPFTQGTVREVAAESGQFTLEVAAGYPEPGLLRERIPDAWGGYPMAEAGEGRFRWPTIGTVSYAAVAQDPDGLWRYSGDAAAVSGLLRPGSRFLQVGRRIAQMALGCAWTRGFYVRDVTVHASPTCGMGLSNVDGASIDGYADMIPAGSDRLLASNADGIFCHGARGGITIRNCYFMGQGDDCINLHSPGFVAQWVTVEGDTRIVLRAEVDVRAGDVLEIVNAATSQVRGQIEVVAAEPLDGGKAVRLELARGLSSVGYDAGTDRVYPADLCAPWFKIVHNYFGQNRSRCVLIQSRHGLIEANTSENAEGYGVILCYGGTAWPEGVLPADVTIRNNVFRNVTNLGIAPPIEAGDGSEFRNLRDIRIEGNQFVNPRKMALSLHGIEGLHIVGNRISTEAGRRLTWNHPQWYPVDCSLYLGNCDRVVIDGLNLNDPGLQEAGIHIMKSCAPGEGGVSIRGLEATLAAGVPAVVDLR